MVGGGRYTVTAPIIKEDYGLYLQIEGIPLPETYEVDFSNDEHSGTSVTMIGNADGVLIPSQFISSGKDVFAFLYHVGADFGRTVYKFRIPNKLRPDRTDEQPTPEEQSVIDQAISALNEAVEQTAQDKADADASAQSASADAERAEEARTDAQNYATQAEDSAQVSHDSALASAGYAGDSANSASASAQSASQAQASAQDASNKASEASASADIASRKASEITGLTAQAETLPSGSNATATYSNGTLTLGIPKGKDGTNGNDGVSPTVSVADITGGHRITITDADGEHSADVMDGDDYTLTAQDKQDIAELVDVPVDDVQINGTSIVQNGVANIVSASTSDIKSGSSVSKFVPTGRQETSVFYGLAKSAGDTTQSQSSNAVGVYTEEAKIAIREMLGLPRYTEAELIADVTTNEDLESVTINTDQNGLPFELRTAKIIIVMPAPTTGKKDYVSSRYNSRKRDGTVNTKNFPTKYVHTATGGVFIFEYENDGGVERIRATTAPRINASTDNITSYIPGSLNEFETCMTAFTLMQYSDTTTLIPAGTRLVIKGIRA